MNFRTSEMMPEESMQLAPMIDIVFLLLIFFLVNYGLMLNERDISIVLPTASAKGTQETQADKTRVYVNITDKGEVRINGIKECSLSVGDPDEKRARKRELIDKFSQMQKLGTKEVSVHADRNTIHQYLIDVLDCCKAAKISNIRMMTNVEK